jgi:hypothetical protein
MTPEKIDQGTMRIRGFIRVMMMSSMDRNPAGGSFLQAADADHGQTVLKPYRTGETTMREQAMVTEIDAEAAEEIYSEQGRALIRSS